MVGPSGSEGVRICLLLGTNGEIKYCQLVSFPRPLGSLQARSFESSQGNEYTGQQGNEENVPAPQGGEHGDERGGAAPTQRPGEWQDLP